MWGDDFHGGLMYKGHCPICGNSNGDVYDSPHEECQLSLPVKCPSCNLMVPSEDIIHGMCSYCYCQSIDEQENINENSNASQCSDELDLDELT